tara:strand:- start:1329 stop:1436 length:108 start_codon:yes stop_codon:yes gene_type:complete
MGKKEILKKLIKLKYEPFTPENKIKIQKLQQKLDK